MRLLGTRSRYQETSWDQFEQRNAFSDDEHGSACAERQSPDEGSAPTRTENATVPIPLKGEKSTPRALRFRHAVPLLVLRLIVADTTPLAVG